MTATHTQVSSNTIIQLDKVPVFQDNVLILDNVSMAIERGEFVYLIGPTGSGKSSLLKLIYAQLPAKDGIARVASIDLRTIKTKQIPFLRRKLGIVFQDFQLLTDRTVDENLLFVLRATGWHGKQDMQSRITEVLEKVGLTGKGPKMPNQLSGGEQQRVGIARALLNRPEIIIADEPTGNLDPVTSEDILELLMNISKTGTAVFMATHDHLLFRRFPARTLCIEEGRLLEKRVHTELNQ
ncbi:MAG TPA: ATP-binding cassette domain-containing protein [Bacteroidales bacterium]|nr:ATP-binding cassette domain-containing protein [Bacteroidales bacterium]